MSNLIIDDIEIGFDIFTGELFVLEDKSFLCASSLHKMFEFPYGKKICVGISTNRTYQSYKVLGRIHFGDLEWFNDINTHSCLFHHWCSLYTTFSDMVIKHFKITRDEHKELYFRLWYYEN